LSERDLLPRSLLVDLALHAVGGNLGLRQVLGIAKTLILRQFRADPREVSLLVSFR
jgi:hypothetical protein